jgi:hypothetical protein
MGYSSIIANVPITKPHNKLERFSQTGFTFGLNECSINFIIIEIIEDAVHPVIFHVGVWQVTQEIAVEEVESNAGSIDYRALIATQNGLLLGGANVTAGHNSRD